MNFDDKFFNKVEKKTKVDKDTIISLATKLQKGNLKDESTLREIISTLSALTGKDVSKAKEDKQETQAEEEQDTLNFLQDELPF